MKYKIVDDFIVGEEFDAITNVVTYDQEYYHVKGITGSPEEEYKNTGYGFGCNFVTLENPGKYQDRKNRDLIQMINNKIMMDYGSEFGFRNVVRSRLDLTTYRGEEVRFHPHTDVPMKNFTSILYFHTCSSPTIVYNETGGYDDDFIPLEEVNNLTEMMRVDSVANRLFIFEGHHFHTGMCAYDVPVRVLLNSNFQ